MYLFALRTSESTGIFCPNDIMCRALWCHLSSLPYQFSIFWRCKGLTTQPPKGKWHISSSYFPLHSTAGEIFLQYCRLSVTQWQQLLNVYPLYHYTYCYCFKNWYLKWELLHAYSRRQNCWDIVLKQGNFREQKNPHPSPVPSIQSWGVCCFL